LALVRLSDQGLIFFSADALASPG